MSYFQIPDFPVRLRRQVGVLAELTGRTTGEIAARCIQAGLVEMYKWAEEVQAKEKREWNPNGE